MSYSKTRLCLLLMLRAFIAIGIVVLLESLFFWRGLLVKFGGEKMLSLPSQFVLTAMVFLIFCIFVLPIVYQWAKQGKLNLPRCMALGAAMGVLPAATSMFGTLLSSGVMEFSLETASLLQTALDFSLPVAGLFWVFGEITDALFPAFDKFSRGEE